jgi:molybdopterin-guanine dinucleotide biosynthesis protein MobB
MTMSQPPAVFVVGKKKSGKTTVVVALVRELTARGLRVGAIKHAAHDHERDTPGTDSYRHREAGGQPTAFLTAGGGAIFWDDSDTEANFRRALAAMGEVDLVVVEGGKHRAGPKIEAFLTDAHEQPLCAAGDDCVAIVTERLTEHFAPIVAPDQIDRLATLVEQRLLGR